MANQVQRALLRIDVPAGDLQASLGGPQLGVGPDDIRHYGQEDLVACLGGGHGVGLGGLDLPRDVAEQVDLPRHVEALGIGDLFEVLRVYRAIEGRIEASLSRVVARCAGVGGGESA